ncbi:MAG: VWA domain-containing protein, partial [Candidatus Pacebacteria bacterium]|nr:VWA domain-containing protein [Candidatus Paceibacterota bacterium]
MKKLKSRLKKSAKKVVASLTMVSLFVVSFLGMTVVTTQEVVAMPAPAQECDAEVDVVLVIDKSFSMFFEGKIEAAKEAATKFVGYMGLNDQTGLVSYNSEDTATLDKALSNNHLLTKQKIDELTVGGGTNMGPAIYEVNQELTSVRANPDAKKIAILLADGDTFNESYVRAQADLSALAGIRFFTIGLGSNIDPSLLQYIAGVTGGAYYYAPTPAELDGIYQEIRYRTCQETKISACKYGTDSNGNNQSIESGWDFTLSGNGYLQTQATDQSGCTTFTNLSPGSYVLSEGNNPGIYEQTYPTDNNGTHVIDLLEGEHLTRDFGNYFPRCGNGTTDLSIGEECDDGENVDGDGCSHDCKIEEPDSVTIVATKIVCDNEESLPNWGDGTFGPITET